MRVAVIDVGSNTARLLVAARDTAPVAPVYEERALLALGSARFPISSLPRPGIEFGATR
jgi:exopolyphosphatase/pppGpp-phosphohydrolase